jgi:hypothetical protein
MDPEDARPEIYDLREDSQGRLWICTWYGVTFRDEEGVWHSIDETLGEYTYAMAMDSEDHIWVAWHDNVSLEPTDTLLEIQPDLTLIWHNSSLAAPLENGVIDLDFDSNDHLWCATDGGGLLEILPEGGFNQYTAASTDSTIPEDRLQHIEVFDDVIWVGLYSLGALRFELSVNPDTDIDVSVMDIDWGNVAVGSGLDRTLTISNTGSNPLEISNITSSDPAFVPNPATLTIEASGSEDITITFSPSVEGPYSATLTITSNDPDEPDVNIALSGNGSGGGCGGGARGDVDGDGNVNVLDVLGVVNDILGTAPLTDPDQQCRADCNADSQINILDALGIVNVILGIGGCEPVTCRPDITPETMGFLKSLGAYLPAEQFDRFMTLVKTEFGIPDAYSLAQNYPNPFNPETSIGYSIASAVHTRLTVYNLLGQEVATLVDEYKNPGSYTVKWTGHDMPTGIYYYRLEAGEFRVTKRMVLTK